MNFLYSIKQTNYRILFLFLLLPALYGNATNGYDLWLKYRAVEDKNLVNEYKAILKKVHFKDDNETLKVAKAELIRAAQGLLETDLHFSTSEIDQNSLIVAKNDLLSQNLIDQLHPELTTLRHDGYLIKTLGSGEAQKIVISANTDLGILYGVFAFLRYMQMNKPLGKLGVANSPKLDIRILNHWDNLDRTVERGYAGFSLWNWQTLPEYIDQRYIDYARANASIGINGTVLTNVNANALVLTPHYLHKVKALADAFRPYGIRVYLTARFSAPMEIGGLNTADPLNSQVREWWKDKASEIYTLIPDFGGFLVKANSEGQPGPQNYGRTHVDGANMLAEAVAPHKGIIMWRAFVYSDDDPTDRAKQAYSEFVPHDGKFQENVLLQVKNGPIDFQPREPFHPMFGAMPNTPLMMEIQLTQEYLGFSTHLVFLPKLFEEVLQADTYRPGKGATVARVIDGSLYDNKISGMSGVANIGNDLNWTGHPFAQANWYGFGRMAWDPDISATAIAQEWLQLTYSNDPNFVMPVKEMLLLSREAVVNYMTPLGLHHIFDTGHHYGPGPWVSNLSRPEWNPVYYHQADSLGVGFDRTASGSNALGQYAPEVAQFYGSLQSCPESYLLWFHHIAWDYPLRDGNDLWDGLALKYQQGVNEVISMIQTWQEVAPLLGRSEHHEVAMLLEIQLKEARWWRDACLLYFQQFSKKELPSGVEKPSRTLDYYKSLKFPYAPGIQPRWE